MDNESENHFAVVWEYYIKSKSHKFLPFTTVRYAEIKS